MLKSLFFVSLIAAAIVVSAAPRRASAFGISPYAVCGTMCMSGYGSMFGPFMGQPWFPMAPGYSSYPMGQMLPPMYSQYYGGMQPMGMPFPMMTPFMPGAMSGGAIPF